MNEGDQRRSQGYDAVPPRCSSCDHKRRVRAADYFPPEKLKHNGWVQFCAIGDFVVTNGAVCDLWSGCNGKECIDSSPAEPSTPPSRSDEQGKVGKGVTP